MEADFNPVRLRRTILEMAHAGASVHVACAFSLVEILSVLYRSHLRYPNNDPRARLRDYLVMSKGHGVMAQYACMRQKGWIEQKELDNYYGNATRLKGLSDAHLPGCEVSGGSLGHGLSVGVGMALAAKLSGTDQKCYAIVGDGEMNEGAIWEALLLAAHRKLDNLVVIVDENGFQAMGTTQEVMALGSLRAKFESFGFDAMDVDGHDTQALDAALTVLKAARNGKPKAIVAKTVKGRGVSFMEHQNMWHYTRLNPETFAQAMAELELPA